MLTVKKKGEQDNHNNKKQQVKEHINKIYLNIPNSFPIITKQIYHLNQFQKGLH